MLARPGALSPHAQSGDWIENEPEGSPPMGRENSRRDLVFGWARRDPDHEAAIRFSGEAPRWRAHSGLGFEAMAVFGSPPPRIMISDLCASARRMLKLGVIPLLFDQMVQATAVRSATPTGISPIVTSRHRAISSFRASATIIVFLRFPAASSVRPRYHCARALSF